MTKKIIQKSKGSLIINSPEFVEGFRLTKDKCLDILYEIEDNFWGDRSGYNDIMKAQMEFAKELRKRISTLIPNNIIDK